MTTTLVEREADNRAEPALPSAISADSHVIEPVEAYTRYIDPAYRDRAPRFGQDTDKGQAYVVDGMPARIAVASVAACGKQARTVTHPDGRQGDGAGRGAVAPPQLVGHRPVRVIDHRGEEQRRTDVGNGRGHRLGMARAQMGRGTPSWTALPGRAHAVMGSRGAVRQRTGRCR